jgi:uncharacterized membrane protein
MPYRWTTTADTTTLTLWPHRSLPRRGFAAFILATFTMITLPLYPLLGTAVLWGLLPFLMLALAGLWWALQRSYRDANITEILTLTPHSITLTRSNPSGPPKIWQANPYWTRAQLHPTSGPVPYYLTLTGNERTVEIGAFLSEAERRRLYGELATALAAASRPPPEP